MSDKFEKIQPLGKGAMGVVHLARDVVLRRKVALKSLLPGVQEPTTLRRFVGEMQITAQLDHPHIVPVYGVEQGPEGSLSYAMKLVEGRELEAVIVEARERLEKGGPLDARTVRRPNVLGRYGSSRARRAGCRRHRHRQRRRQRRARPADRDP